MIANTGMFTSTYPAKKSNKAIIKTEQMPGRKASPNHLDRDRGWGWYVVKCLCENLIIHSLYAPYADRVDSKLALFILAIFIESRSLKLKKKKAKSKWSVKKF